LTVKIRIKFELSVVANNYLCTLFPATRCLTTQVARHSQPASAARRLLKLCTSASVCGHLFLTQRGNETSALLASLAMSHWQHQLCQHWS